MGSQLLYSNQIFHRSQNSLINLFANLIIKMKHISRLLNMNSLNNLEYFLVFLLQFLIKFLRNLSLSLLKVFILSKFKQSFSQNTTIKSSKSILQLRNSLLSLQSFHSVLILKQKANLFPVIKPLFLQLIDLILQILR